MRHTRRELLGIAAAGTTGLIAGCTGASGTAQETTTEDTMTTTQTTQTTTTNGTDDQPGGYTVEVRTHPEYGVILTDAEGMTLYLFTRDTEGESTCTGDCAAAWPPLTVEGELSIPDGLPGTFATIERDDGSTQVTYNGMALYYFQNDEQPGDATGQGVNDVWFVVNPTCEGATATTTEGDTTTTEGDTTTTEDGGGYY